MPAACIVREYRMDRRRIALLRFLLEAYDGIATLTTLDAPAGRVRLAIAPGCETDVDELIDDIRGTIRLRPTIELL